MVSKIKFYMDYFVSKLSLIYFSTFSGNRFNSDYTEMAILELVVAGCFKKAAEPGDAIWDTWGNAK